MCTCVVFCCLGPIQDRVCAMLARGRARKSKLERARKEDPKASGHIKVRRDADHIGGIRVARLLCELPGMLPK